jgi:hypothetical protein
VVRVDHAQFSERLRLVEDPADDAVEDHQ